MSQDINNLIERIYEIEKKLEEINNDIDKIKIIVGDLIPVGGK